MIVVGDSGAKEGTVCVLCFLVNQIREEMDSFVDANCSGSISFIVDDIITELSRYYIREKINIDITKTSSHVGQSFLFIYMITLKIGT